MALILNIDINTVLTTNVLKKVVNFFNRYKSTKLHKHAYLFTKFITATITYVTKW